jgi:hypothetical protein
MVIASIIILIEELTLFWILITVFLCNVYKLKLIYKKYRDQKYLFMVMVKKKFNNH